MPPGRPVRYGLAVDLWRSSMALGPRHGSAELWLRRALAYWDTRSIVSQVIAGVITAFVVAAIVGWRRKRRRRR